jgi:hypothetical protein
VVAMVRFCGGWFIPLRSIGRPRRRSQGEQELVARS